MHAELTVGNSTVMLGQAGREWKALPRRCMSGCLTSMRPMRGHSKARGDVTIGTGRQALWAPQRRRRRPERNHVVDWVAHPVVVHGGTLLASDEDQRRLRTRLGGSVARPIEDLQDAHIGAEGEDDVDARILRSDCG